LVLAANLLATSDGILEKVKEGVNPGTTNEDFDEVHK
jgi:hypothetical protein